MKDSTDNSQKLKTKFNEMTDSIATQGKDIAVANSKIALLESKLLKLNDTLSEMQKFIASEAEKKQSVDSVKISHKNFTDTFNSNTVAMDASLKSLDSRLSNETLKQNQRGELMEKRIGIVESKQSELELKLTTFQNENLERHRDLRVDLDSSKKSTETSLLNIRSQIEI